MNTAVPPALVISPATILPSPSSWSAMTTLAPSLPKRRAVAAPMPDAAPLMIATLLASRIGVPPFRRVAGKLACGGGLGYRPVSRQDGGDIPGVTRMAHRGLKFGIFLAPFHRVGENPTLAIG